MPKSIAVKPRKRGRPPAGGRDPFVGIRLPADTILAIDQLAKESAISRSAAIRQLVEQALAVRSHRKPAKERKAHRAAASQQRRQKASELADQTANRLIDKLMPVEEQQRRKRSLIKGPKEFRDIRKDLPKSKRG